MMALRFAIMHQAASVTRRHVQSACRGVAANRHSLPSSWRAFSQQPISVTVTSSNEDGYCATPRNLTALLGAAAIVAAGAASFVESDAHADSSAGVSGWQPLPAPGQQADGKDHRPGGKFANLADMIDDVFPSLCKIQGAIGDRQLGGGSGFVISEEGLIVTNDHVFQAMAQAGAREIQAMFDDGRSYRIEPLAADSEADIAIGRIIAPPGTKFKALKIGRSDAMRRGDAIAVLGAPLGGSLVPAVGVLGGTRYVADDEVMNYVLNSRADWCLLQVDANMSSGSSGGPIVNADGEVVGVSVMVQTAGTMGVGNLNYGVAIDQAYPIIRSLLRHGYVTRAAIGMTIVLVDGLQNEREMATTGVQLLPPPARDRSGSSSSGGSSDYRTGLLVTYALPGKPAEAAGVREGDVILEINGRKMTRKGDYFAALGPIYEPGKRLECKIWRPNAASGGGRGGRAAGGAGGQVISATIVPVVRDASHMPGGGQGRRGRGWFHR